jgi:hypothetical protein
VVRLGCGGLLGGSGLAGIPRWVREGEVQDKARHFFVD